MSTSRSEESPLGAVLSRDERGHLVILIGSIVSSVRERAAAAVNDPTKSRSVRWIDKWHETVINRVSEAANTRWEPLRTSKPKDWDELSWDAPAEKLVDDGHDTSLHHLYPPIPSPLTSLNHERRVKVLNSVLLILLSLKHYYAPSRVLMVHLASSLDLSLSALNEDEEKTAETLMSTAKALSAQEEVDNKAKENQSARRWKVGLAGVAGAALIGVTGGLAAPLVAAGLGTVLGGLGLGATAAAGLLGSLAGSSVLVGGLFGAYGAKMTSSMVDQYAREVSDFKFIPLRKSDDRRLRITITISGWLNERQEILTPWRVLGAGTEVFALRWELDALLNLGSGLSAMVTSAAWNYAKMEVLKHTVFASILGAVMLPLGLLQLGSMVDNPFRVAKNRSDKAGEVLADALINRAQGERPVALVGYSLGARVIYSCLLSLQKRRAYGLIDSVVLIGAPIPSDPMAWQAMRSMVAGRLVNVYSENDYVLGFLYRTNSAQVDVAGLQKIEAVGIENKNVSDIVNGHMRYKVLIGQVLQDIGWEDLNIAEIEREHQALVAMEAAEKEIERKIEAEQASHAGEKEELIASMEKKVSVKHLESTPKSSNPLPTQVDEQSLNSPFSSMSIQSNPFDDAARAPQKQVPRRQASKPQTQPQQQPLIDLLGDDPPSEPPLADPLSSNSATVQTKPAGNSPNSPGDQRPGANSFASSISGTSGWPRPTFQLGQPSQPARQIPQAQSNVFVGEDESWTQRFRAPPALNPSSSSSLASCAERGASEGNQQASQNRGPEAGATNKANAGKLVAVAPEPVHDGASKLIQGHEEPEFKRRTATYTSDNDDDEPKFGGIQMVDNDPDLL